jgi:hypothetical protein
MCGRTYSAKEESVVEGKTGAGGRKNAIIMERYSVDGLLWVSVVSH